jgi:uncharacterized protein YjdB
MPHTAQLHAMVQYRDGSERDVSSDPDTTWASADDTKVTVSATGLATGVAVTTDPVNVTATYPAPTDADPDATVSASCAVTVEAVTTAIVIDQPSPQALEYGETVQLSAHYLTDQGNEVATDGEWVSATPSVADVDADGLVTADSTAGIATITVRGRGFTSDPVQVNVTAPTVDSVTLDQSAQTVPIGSRVALSATEHLSNGTTRAAASPTFASSAPAVVAIDGSDAVGTAQGTASITATSSGKTSAGVTFTVPAPTLDSITIDQSTPQTVENGSTLALTATGHYSDGSTQAVSGGTWASSDEAVATVDSSGTVTAVADTGTANITVASGGKTSAALVVNAAPAA